MAGVSQMDLAYGRRTPWFIFLSFALHALFMLVLSNPWELFGNRRDSKLNSDVAIEVVELTSQQVRELKGQIVETELGKKSDRLVDTPHLSSQNQIVERQTKARTTAPFQQARPGGASNNPSEQQQAVSLGALGVKMNMKPMGNLGPGQISSSNDYLKNVQPGAQTLLNTREYAYFSFYQRVRRQLEQYWEPGLRQRLKSMFDRGRQLAADREHATKLTVVMDKDGSITRILVEGTSGLLDLDQAAVDAFNRAGPFPNPPQGMMDKDGTVRIEWEFVLKT